MNFVSVECDDEDIGEEAMSCDSVDVERVCLLDPTSIFPGQTLAYICETSDGDEEVYDRSDLMDGGRIQKLVRAYERKNPPPWQPCGGHAHVEPTSLTPAHAMCRSLALSSAKLCERYVHGLSL